MPAEKNWDWLREKRERKKAIREKRRKGSGLYSPGYKRHSARQHSISPKMFFIVYRLAARGCQNVAAGCTLSAKLIPDWEDRESGSSALLGNVTRKCVRHQRNFSFVRFNAASPTKPRATGLTSTTYGYRARAQRVHSRISIIVLLQRGGRILKRWGVSCRELGVSGISPRRAPRNISYIRLFNVPRYDNLMLPRSVNVRYASEP